MSVEKIIETEKPLISVVIPTHNRAWLLPRAIESAQRQTYKNIEIIVVSDGSEDDTDDLMEKIVKNDERVRYYSYHPAKGGNHARNKGIELSVGEIVAFLDDDDVWHDDKLERQWEIFESDKEIGLVCTGINSIAEGRKFNVRFIPPAKNDSSKLILTRNCIGSTTTVAVKKEIFEKSGVFDEKLKALQDYDLWVRICQVTKIGVVRDECVDYYNYKNSNQISSDTKKYEEAIERIKEKYKDLIEQLSDREKKLFASRAVTIIAKKVFRNTGRRQARKYFREAKNIILTKETFFNYLSTFFPYGFVSFINHIKRKMKK